MAVEKAAGFGELGTACWYYSRRRGRQAHAAPPGATGSKVVASQPLLGQPPASARGGAAFSSAWSEAPEQGGCLLTLGFDEALAAFEADLLPAIQAAMGYPLATACLPSEALLTALWGAVRSLGAGDPRDGDTWDALMNKRIQETWRSRDPGTIWLDDKVAQVGQAARLCQCSGENTLHLPFHSQALSADDGAEQQLLDAIEECASRREPIVLKPRHGANSRHVFLWPAPHEVDEATRRECVGLALHGRDESWDRECWQLSQVPRGALIQPMYNIAVPLRPDGGPKMRAAPLELKVQVLFGRVAGATLNTHPQHLWILRNGCIQLWDTEELKARGHTRCRKLDRCYGASLPEGALELLQGVLSRSWCEIRDTSERLTREAELDELRVDWLLGDERWGPRIGELTYMGAGSRITTPLSARLARAFAAGHLCRLHKASLLPGPQLATEDGEVLHLWPTGSPPPVSTRTHHTPRGTGRCASAKAKSRPRQEPVLEDAADLSGNGSHE